MLEMTEGMAALPDLHGMHCSAIANGRTNGTPLGASQTIQIPSAALPFQ